MLRIDGLSNGSFVKSVGENGKRLGVGRYAGVWKAPVVGVVTGLM